MQAALRPGPDVKINGRWNFSSNELLHGSHGNDASRARVNWNQFQLGAREDVPLAAMPLAGPEIKPLAARQINAASGCALSHDRSHEQIGAEHELIISRRRPRVVLIMPEERTHDRRA